MLPGASLLRPLTTAGRHQDHPSLDITLDLRTFRFRSEKNRSRLAYRSKVGYIVHGFFESLDDSPWMTDVRDGWLTRGA